MGGEGAFPVLGNQQVQRAMLAAYAYAIRAHREYERFGFPEPGTVRDQPMVWRLAVLAIGDASAEGQAQAQAQARKEARDD